MLTDYGIIWIKPVQEEFEKIGGLTADELDVMRHLWKGHSVVETALALNRCESWVKEKRKKAWEKYDACQPFSNILKPRKVRNER